MDCMKIEAALSELKVNSRGSIRGKNQVIDKIHSMHLKAMDDVLMDIRVYVAKFSGLPPNAAAFKAIDEFIYRRSVGAK